ncbi:MAG: lysoplasmalogenase [Desulfobacteraceae bacterium]|jgi:uncharacterized membrane protein YhhN
MEQTVLFPAALLFLLGLLHFERKSVTKGILLTKPVVSLLFVVTALGQHPLSSSYFAAILIALLLSLIGDVCLIFMDSRKMFLAGLLSFLLGHMAYVAAFSPFVRTGAVTWIALCIFSAAGAIVFRWLRPNLGTMKIPVVAYILIITAMVVCAVTLVGNTGLSTTGRYMVLIGALSFYASDIFVARNQFVIDAYINRLIGLPLYYLAQFLFAISIAYIG